MGATLLRGPRQGLAQGTPVEAYMLKGWRYISLEFFAVSRLSARSVMFCQVLRGQIGMQPLRLRSARVPHRVVRQRPTLAARLEASLPIVAKASRALVNSDRLRVI
jgi:hypothetical protein